MRIKSHIRLCLVLSLAILAGGAMLLAQEPDQAALQAARKLRAEAAYQELKGNAVEAARLFEESLKHVADEKVAAKVRELRGEAVPEQPEAEKPDGVTNSVRRKVNDQRPDEVEIVVEVEGLDGEFAAETAEYRSCADLMPGSKAVAEMEQIRYGSEHSVWQDEGPYVLRSGYSSAGRPVTIRVTCPEKPAITPAWEGDKSEVRSRRVYFVTYGESRSGDIEVKLTDNEDGTASWTPELQDDTGILCGPTVIGVYVRYNVESHGGGTLSGGTHRAGWILVANPGMLINLDNKLHTVMGPGRAPEPRPAWELPPMPETAEPRLITQTEKNQVYRLEVKVSDDCRRFVRLDKRNHTETIYIENSRGPTYDSIYYPLLSKDGKNLFYIGKLDKWEVPVFNGMEGIVCKDIRNVVFSSDYAHHAFSVSNNSGSLVVVDNEVVARIEEAGVNGVFMSPDGSRTAWLQVTGEGTQAVVDGNPGKLYPQIKPDLFRFSPDSRHFGYVADYPDRSLVVLDGVEQAIPHASEKLVFSQDGTQLAYVGKVDGGVALVLNGVAGPAQANIDGYPVFSPDGKRLGYRVYKDGNGWLVVDGVESLKAYNSWAISRAVFSPDSSRMAYAFDLEKGVSVLMLDGKEVFRGTNLREVSFSPDGKRLACFDKQEKGYCAVVDGVAGPVSRQLYYEEPVIFSPDSAHFFTFDRQGDDVQLLMDNKVIYRAEIIVPEIRFHKAGKLMIGAYKEGELSLVEVAYP